MSLVNLGASVLAVAIGIHSSKKSIQNFKSMWNGMRSKSGNYSSLRDLMSPEEAARYDRYWSQDTDSFLSRCKN